MNPARNRKQIIRCDWVTTGNTLYEKYHDIEWGVPAYDDKTIFEFLVLESAQAGLSWITILKKRENYRKAFAKFDPKKVAKFGSKEVRNLLKNEGIVRNKLKIEATINNAERFLEVQKEFGTFSKYIWSFVGEKPIQNKWKNIKELPSVSKEAIELSKDLKKRGFKFIGPTICYAHMQATGMVNDHTTNCFRYKKVKILSAD